VCFLPPASQAGSCVSSCLLSLPAGGMLPVPRYFSQTVPYPSSPLDFLISRSFFFPVTFDTVPSPACPFFSYSHGETASADFHGSFLAAPLSFSYSCNRPFPFGPFSRYQGVSRKTSPAPVASVSSSPPYLCFPRKNRVSTSDSDPILHHRRLFSLLAPSRLRQWSRF